LRIAGAEIVDGDGDAVALEFVGAGFRRGDVAHDLVFGHFKNEAGPGVGFRPVLLDDLDNRQLGQRAGRHVDGQMQVEAGIVKHSPITQGGEQCVFGQMMQARLIDAGQKAFRP
jgi:hypothetical protein